MANEGLGTRHGVLDKIDEQSGCSENLTNTSSEMYGSSARLDQESKAVHMACVQEVHHYQVDRDLDDGESHPEYENDYEDYLLREVSTSSMMFEDRDGQLWSYEDEIIPCNDA
jgi:hypothetical protein